MEGAGAGSSHCIENLLVGFGCFLLLVGMLSLRDTFPILFSCFLLWSMVNAVLIVSLAIIYYSPSSYLYIAYIHVFGTLANSLGSTIKWEYLKDV